MVAVKAWAGWKLEGERMLRAPKAIVLAASEGALLAALMDADGAILSRRSLACAIGGVSRSVRPEEMVGMVVHNINRRLSGHGRIANVRRFGYRLLPAGTRSAIDEAAEAARAVRRAKVEAILIDELEATGPHARAVSRLIEEVYS